MYKLEFNMNPNIHFVTYYTKKEHNMKKFDDAIQLAANYRVSTTSLLTFEIDDSPEGYEIVRNLAQSCGAVGCRLIKIDTYDTWQVPEDFQGESGRYMVIEE